MYKVHLLTKWILFAQNLTDLDGVSVNCVFPAVVNTQLAHDAPQGDTKDLWVKNGLLRYLLTCTRELFRVVATVKSTGCVRVCRS